MKLYAHPDDPWGRSPAERARDTADFLAFSGLKYYTVTARILTIAENACVVVDGGGKQRIIRWPDLSFASWHIVRQNPGAVVEPKIRKWV